MLTIKLFLNIFPGFTTKRPESFEDAPCTLREKKLLPPDAILSDNPADVDLYVASTNKVKKVVIEPLVP